MLTPGCVVLCIETTAKHCQNDAVTSQQTELNVLPKYPMLTNKTKTHTYIYIYNATTTLENILRFQQTQEVRRIHKVCVCIQIILVILLRVERGGYGMFGAPLWKPSSFPASCQAASEPPHSCECEGPSGAASSIGGWVAFEWRGCFPAK